MQSPVKKFLSPDVAEANDEPSLEERVELHLLSLNRHERRAWFARLARRAGKQRKTVLQAKMPQEKADRKAARNGTA